MAATYSSRDIVDGFLRNKLRDGGVAWRFPHARPQRDASSLLPWRSETPWMSDDPLVPPRLQAALQRASEELERRYRGDLSAQLTVLTQLGGGGGDERWRSLTVIRNELFRDGVNWGRIVTMMAVGGALSADMARAGHMGQLDKVADWMVEGLDSPPIQRWIEDNGGWDAFVELYESKPSDGFWSMRTLFGLAVLGAAGITLGALFTRR